MNQIVNTFFNVLPGWTLIGIFIGLIVLLKYLRIVNSYERAIILRRGIYVATRAPGFYQNSG